MNTATPPLPLSQLHRILAQDAADKHPSPTDTADQGWDRAWATGCTPWDSKDVQPALKELVDSNWHKVQLGDVAKWGEDSVTTPGSKALIAGCGRVRVRRHLLRCPGLDSLGLDLSPTAIKAAQDLYKATENAPKNVEFRAADFFKFPPPVAGFDLAYDYTFFCAIPPELRQSWADRYAQIIRKGGVLITLMFPIDGDRSWGPPFSVSEEMYDQYLSRSFEKIHSENPGASMEERKGREKMAVWKRR
ncbi:BZ3501_MvSof-1269-A2-R1_Chr2-1g04342 [Microbotryum saponariae]|nr:BZ3501_MvSof-1269-A2-R1_Chr2-1g04342 [Microbotryum saponariae]